VAHVGQVWKRGKKPAVTKEAVTEERSVFDLVRPYERLLSFLTSYVVILSGSGQLNILVDQYSIWRTARAIAIAVLLIFVEAFVLLGAAVLPHPSSMNAFLFQSVNLLLVATATVLSMAFTLGTYSRLCFTLFAFVYVTYNKQLEANRPTASDGDCITKAKRA
jgi:hypothetical protein